MISPDMDIVELLTFLEGEAAWNWQVAASHRHIFPGGTIAQAQKWDRRAAAIRDLMGLPPEPVHLIAPTYTPENVECPRCHGRPETFLDGCNRCDDTGRSPENVETRKNPLTMKAVYRCVDCGQRLPCDCTPENVEERE